MSFVRIHLKQGLSILVYLLLASLLIGLHVRLQRYAFDDAYIHFRVASHLIETGAPYFNPHEMVKVSTSSGWVVFLAIVYGLARIVHAEGSLPLLIGIINAITTFAVMIVYSKVAGSVLGSKLTLLQNLVLQAILLAVLLPSSIGLMETPLALLIAGLGLYWLLRAKLWGFALLGLSIYFRLELSILVLLVCVFSVFRSHVRIPQMIGYLCSGVLPLVCFDLYFYHSVVPHSVIAKSLIYDLTPMNTIMDVLKESIPGLSLAGEVLPIVGDITLILIVIQLCRTILDDRAILKTSFYPAVLCVSGLLILLLYICQHTLLFDWYVPLYMVPITVALFLYTHSSKFPNNAWPGILLLLLFGLSASCISLTAYAAFYKPNYFTLFESSSRVKTYQMVGKIIQEDYPDATFLSSEIGGLGYVFKGKIFDAAGLASPDSLAFHPLHVPDQRSSGYLGAIPPGYVKSVNPDIIVSYDTFAEALLLDPLTAQYNIYALPAYQPADIVFSETGTIWGSTYIRVYVRKSLPVSKKICALAVFSNAPSTCRQIQ